MMGITSQRISTGWHCSRQEYQSDGSNTGIGIDNPHLNVNLTYHAA